MNNATANEPSTKENKIYVSPEKIRITNSGIFFLNEIGDFIPANVVSCDEAGVYVVAKSECGICHGLYGRHKDWCPLGNLPNSK